VDLRVAVAGAVEGDLAGSPGKAASLRAVRVARNVVTASRLIPAAIHRLLPTHRWSAVSAATATGDTTKNRLTRPTLAHQAAARAIPYSTDLASARTPTRPERRDSRNSRFGRKRRFAWKAELWSHR